MGLSAPTPSSAPSLTAAEATINNAVRAERLLSDHLCVRLRRTGPTRGRPWSPVMHASRRRAPRPARAPATGGADREPVGDRMLGGLRAFRYEIRRWPGGRIPDVADAVDSPPRLTDDPAVARRLLQLLPKIPRLVWGRDEARTGDMWTSNSITAWLLVRSA